MLGGTSVGRYVWDVKKKKTEEVVRWQFQKCMLQSDESQFCFMLDFQVNSIFVDIQALLFVRQHEI